MTDSREPRTVASTQHDVDLDSELDRTILAGEKHLLLVEQFLERYGEAAFDDAMACGPMFAGLREQSRFSVRTAVQAAEVGLPSAVMFQFRPRAARKGEQVEARLLMGDGHQVISGTVGASKE